MKTIVLDETLRRDADACECPSCGGYAEEVIPTKDEIRKYQSCGRNWACCLNAFICKKCGQRIVSHLEAPEME